MTTAAVEALFSTARLDAEFLTPETAPRAGAVLMAAPGFCQGEWEAAPDPELAGEVLAGLMTGPLPPGVMRGQVFPLGLTLKGKPGFIGLAHLIVGFPRESAATLGLLVFAESNQRKGFGREFITGVYDWARPQGIDFLRVRLHPRHDGAKAFLDKLGFVDLPESISSGHVMWERKLPATED